MIPMDFTETRGDSHKIKTLPISDLVATLNSNRTSTVKGLMKDNHRECLRLRFKETKNLIKTSPAHHMHRKCPQIKSKVRYPHKKDSVFARITFKNILSRS